MHKDAGAEIKGIYSPRDLFTQPDELDLIDISNADANIRKTPRQWLYTTNLDPPILVSLTPNRLPISLRLASTTSLC